VSDYHINVMWSDEDECYVADIPDLTYCSAFGATPQEALAEVLVAKELWLDTAQAEGKPVLPLRYRPVIYEAMGIPRSAAG
jgi:predicted RNase H-like HicB family nuclease